LHSAHSLASLLRFWERQLPKQAASVQKYAPGLRAMQAVLSAEAKQSGQQVAETKQQQQPKARGKRADLDSTATAQPPAKQAAPATQHRPRIRAREILRAALLDAFGAVVACPVPSGVVALVAEYARMPQFVGTIEPAVPAQRKEPVRGLRTDRGLKVRCASLLVVWVSG
jgi:hypothetical protein